MVAEHNAESVAPEPYYEDAFVTLYHGDCLSILPTFGDRQFDLVLTDPPYNVGLIYGAHNDKMATTDYAAWCRNWFSECHRVGAKVVVFPGQGNLGVWIPEKPSGVGCWYKPGNPSSSHLGWSEWEPWLYWGQRLGGSDVLRAPVNSQSGVGDHPCPKPLSLFTRLLQKTKATTVIDPFVGSGTTLKAAKSLGVRAVGIEIEERFCEIIAGRLAQEVLDFGATA